MIASSRVTVGTTATALNTQPVGRRRRRSIAIRNIGATTLYLGGSTVTTADGYPVDAGNELTYDLMPTEQIYGVVAAAGTAAVMEGDL